MRSARLAWLVLLLVLALPGLAQAAGGNILDPKLDLTLWTIVVFGLLYLTLRYVKLPGAPAPAWVMMMEGLKKREERIHSALEEADKAREAAQTLRVQMQEEISRAHEKVRETIEEARRDAQHTRDEMMVQARAEIATERDRLRREIETAKDQALQELWQQSAQLATLISYKAIGRQLTEDDHRRLVDEAMNELGSATRTGRQQRVGKLV